MWFFCISSTYVAYFFNGSILGGMRWRISSEISDRIGSSSCTASLNYIYLAYTWYASKKIIYYANSILTVYFYNCFILCRYWRWNLQEVLGVPRMFLKMSSTSTCIIKSFISCLHSVILRSEYTQLIWHISLTESYRAAILLEGGS